MRRAILTGIVLIASLGSPVAAQQKPKLSADEQALMDQLRKLRQVPDQERGGVTQSLALQIRRLPATPGKLTLAVGLSHLATEGDFGKGTLQEVATTLAGALEEQPQPDDKDDGPASAYVRLAELVHYEDLQVHLDAPPLRNALAKLDDVDRQRAIADFALRDLNGKEWKLSSLRGAVVLVNFWATWCPPCRKEMPDLESLYARFRDKGFIVLAISDENAAKVTPFVKQQNVSYPILLDQGRQVGRSFIVGGIPKSFVFNREGKLVATAIDMRTKEQFLAMLAKAGLE